MKKIPIILAFLFIIVSFFINILGLMHLIPVYLTSPLLFVSLLILIVMLNNQHRFRGFRK